MHAKGSFSSRFGNCASITNRHRVVTDFDKERWFKRPTKDPPVTKSLSRLLNLSIRRAYFHTAASRRGKERMHGLRDDRTSLKLTAAEK